MYSVVLTNLMLQGKGNKRKKYSIQKEELNYWGKNFISLIFNNFVKVRII